MVNDIFQAIQKLSHSTVANTLTEEDVKLLDANKNTPLHVACAVDCKTEFQCASRLKIVRTMILYGADLQQENGKGQWPVDVALNNDDFELVKILTHQTHLSSLHHIYIGKPYLNHALETARHLNKEHYVSYLKKEIEKCKSVDSQELLCRSNRVTSIRDTLSSPILNSPPLSPHFHSFMDSPSLRFSEPSARIQQTITISEADEGTERDIIPQIVAEPVMSSTQIETTTTEEKIPKYTNLVFQGGGVLGISYVGALRELMNCKHFSIAKLKRVAGTSAGALFAGLIAVGYDVDGIYKILFPSFTQFLDDSIGDNKQRFEKLVSESMENGVGFFTKLDMIYNVSNLFFDRLKDNLGVFPGLQFLDKYRGYVKTATGVTKLTFKKLHEMHLENPEKYKDLYVVSLDICTGEAKVFSHETTPEEEVALACRMSMSVPMLFAPVKYPPNAPASQQHMFVDGGENLNYPLTLFDKKKYLSDEIQDEATKDHIYYNEETLGVRIVDLATIDHYLKGKELPAKPMPTNDMAGFVTYVLYLISLDKSVQENLFTYSDPNSERSVFIDSSNVNFINFNLSDGEKNLLMRAGKVGVQSFFERRNIRTLKKSLKELEEQMLDQQSQGIIEPMIPYVPPVIEKPLRKKSSSHQLIEDVKSGVSDLEKTAATLRDSETELHQKIVKLEKETKAKQKEIDSLRLWRQVGICCLSAAVVPALAIVIVLLMATTNNFGSGSSQFYR
jgi:NTE family protein